MRGLILSLKEKEFVDAARASGASAFRIITRHILPNIIGPIAVNITLVVGEAIVAESTLSFLGFGLQPPAVSWGTMLNNGESTIGTPNAYLIYFPGLALLLTVLCVNFLGDGLRDAFDPQSGKLFVSASREPILSVRDLHVSFPTDDGLVLAVDGVSFDVGENEVLGVVGESGSGKSVTSLAIMGLLPKRAVVTGEILFRGRDLLTLRERERQELRGGRIAMVFQDALAALNPVFTVGHQIAEAVRAHNDIGRHEAKNRSVELLDIVGIPNPKARVDQYPHEFSGGMRQRAMIAMAIANDPDVLIADEPTTALDVTIQAQVLEVFERIQERTSSAVVLITHDLGVVAGVADRVLVMYAGRAVEVAGVDEIFYESRHPYTRGLLGSLPRVDGGRDPPPRPHQGPAAVAAPPAPGVRLPPRCGHAEAPGSCNQDRPELAEFRPGHASACHFAAAAHGRGGRCRLRPARRAPERRERCLGRRRPGRRGRAGRHAAPAGEAG